MSLPKRPTITVQNHDLHIKAEPARSLLNNFLINDAPIHTTCGGHANCGCCRVKIINGRKGVSPANNREIKRLGNDLIEGGWRLSCQTYTLRDLVVHMPTSDELDSRCSKK